MSECPECVPLKAEWVRLSEALGSLETALSKTRADRVAKINEAVRRVNNAQHWLSVSMARYAAASSYAHSADDAAQVGGHPDLSLTPREGWVEIEASPGVTVWARNEEARKFLAGLMAGGAAAAEAARAGEMAEDLRGEYEANIDRLASAKRILEKTIQEWDAKVAAAEEAIPPARQAQSAAYAAYLACMEACAKPRKRDAVAAAFGAAMLVGGLFALGASGADATTAVSGVAAAASGVIGVSTPFSNEVLITVDVEVASEVPDVTTDTVAPEPVEPTIASYCSGTDHYPKVPATDADGGTIRSPSKQVIGAYTTGLPPGTRMTMDVKGIGTTTGEVNADGYVEFQLPLRSYGTYTITSVTADVDGSTVEFDPQDVGSPFRVGDAERDCTQGTLTAPTTTTTSTTTTTTAPPTVVPTPTYVPAGGGAVPIPPTVTDAGGGGGTIVTPGTPETPGGGVDVATLALGAALVVAGSATLGGLGAPGMGAQRGTTTRGGERDATDSVDPDFDWDDIPGEPMDMSSGTLRPFPAVPSSGGSGTGSGGVDQSGGATQTAADTGPRSREVDDPMDPDFDWDDIPGEPMDMSSGTLRPFPAAPSSGGSGAGGGAADSGSTSGQSGPDASTGSSAPVTPIPSGPTATVSKPVVPYDPDLDATESEPTAPAITEPRIRIDTGGNGDDSINAYQTFRIVAEYPRTGTEPPEFKDVVISSSSGSSQTVTLKWDGSARGSIVYRSNLMSLTHGGQGAGRTTFMGLEFSSGGLSRFGVDNDDVITVTDGETSTTILAFESWVQQGINRSMEVALAKRLYWSRVADDLARQEQTPAVIASRRSITRIMEEAAKIDSILHNEELGDPVKLAYISTRAQLMGGGGDPRFASSTIRTIAEGKREEYARRILESGIGDVCLAMYRTIVEASFAASAYRLGSGYDITGRKLSTREHILAAVELAGWVTTATGGQTRDLANLLSGGGTRAYKDLGEGFVDTHYTRTGVRPTRIPGAPPSLPKTPGRSVRSVAKVPYPADLTPVPPRPGPLPGTTARQTAKVPDPSTLTPVPTRPGPLPSTLTRPPGKIVAPGARLPDPSTLRPVPTRPGPIPDVPVDTSVLRAKAGTSVLDPKAFGMTPEAYFHFQSVARRWGLIIRVRAANIASVRWLYRGHPPKHVKLKSKSIKPIDYHLGAKEGTEGLVGYFKPTLPRNINSLDPGLAKAIRKRYKQRLLEYADNATDMSALERKGLVRVDDGVVIDTGLSSTRLEGDTLVSIPGRPKGGTGLGVTGDYDQYSSMSRTPDVATAEARMAAAQAELSGGHANVQHPWHIAWQPTNERDWGIRNAICDGHRGEVLPDGGIGPLQRVVDGREHVAEGLIEFGRSDGPVVAYDIDVGGP